MSTEIRTPDNLTVIVPNSKLTSERIVNYSQRDTRRLSLSFGVSYEADIRRVRGLLKRMAAEDNLVLKEPEPTIAVQELGGMKIDVEIWVKSQDYSKGRAEMNEKIKERCDSEKIPIL